MNSKDIEKYIDYLDEMKMSLLLESSREPIKLTQEEVDEMIDEHSWYLMTGDRKLYCKMIVCGKDLRGISFLNKDVSRVNFSGCDLRGCDFRLANVTGCSFEGALMDGCQMFGCIGLSDYPLQCPEEGNFTAWKRVDGFLCKILVMEDSQRLSGISKRCKTDKVRCISIHELDGRLTDLTCVEGKDIFEVGQITTSSNYNSDRWDETSGITFYLTKKEARLDEQ